MGENFVLANASCAKNVSRSHLSPRRSVVAMYSWPKSEILAFSRGTFDRLLRLASVCDFEELKRVILNLRVQWNIPGDNYVIDTFIVLILVRGSSAVECRTRNQVSPGSNPPLVPFRRLGIFVLSINAPVDSAV